MMDGRQVLVSAETLAELKRVRVPTAAGLMLGLGYRNSYMIGPVPLVIPGGATMVGRALTLRFLPQREDLQKAQYSAVSGSPHRTALETIGPGEALIIDAGGCLGAAVVGDMFTRRIKERGAVGLIIDGVVRDLSAIRTIGLPVFARGQHGAGITRELMSVGINEPIQCGGIPVIPGDVVLADEDGVVVIPPALAAEVAQRGTEHEDEEEFIRMKLMLGASLHDVYPPNDAARKELEEWRRAGRPPLV